MPPPAADVALYSALIRVASFSVAESCRSTDNVRFSRSLFRRRRTSTSFDCESSSALFNAVVTARATAEATALAMRALCESPVSKPDCSRVSRTKSSICLCESRRIGCEGDEAAAAATAVVVFSLVAPAFCFCLISESGEVVAVELRVVVEDGELSGPRETRARSALILVVQSPGADMICREVSMSTKAVKNGAGGL